MENEILTLSGERKFANEEKQADYYRVERSYGKFSRSFRVPYAIDVTSVHAAYKNRELEVMLPRIWKQNRTQLMLKHINPK